MESRTARALSYEHRRRYAVLCEAVSYGTRDFAVCAHWGQETGAISRHANDDDVTNRDVQPRVTGEAQSDLVVWGVPTGRRTSLGRLVGRQEG